MEQTAGGISSQSYLTMKINGEVMPASPGLFRALHVIEHSAVPPQSYMDLIDQRRTLRNELALVDGTKLEIDFGTSQEDAETIYLSVIGTREIEEGGQRLLRVICLIDSPAYLFDTKTLRKKGTSTQVLGEIAGDYGFEFDCDIQGSDSMNWLSVATSPRLFVRDIEQHIWVSDSAFPAIAITFDRKMIVRDLNKVIVGEAAHTFVFHAPSDKKAFMFEELVPTSVSGMFNAISNYGDRAVWSDEEGDQPQLNSVSIESNDNPNVSSTTRKDIQGSRVRQLPPSPDSNTHQNWTKAKYNWTRHSLAYTEAARGLVRGKVPVKMFECIDLISGQYSEQTGESQEDEKNSYKWVVMGKTRSIVQGQYLESYLIARNYTTVEGNSEVGGGSNQPVISAPTAASPVRPPQINPNIKQGLDGLSPIESYIKEYDIRVTLLDQQFIKDSEMFAFPELVEKYGEGIDYLKALMSEFSMAAFLTKMCGALNVLEKLSLNLTLDLGTTILGAIADRIESYEDLLDDMTNDMNGLIAAGEIPAQYLDGLNINQRCVSNKIDDLRNSINDKLPDTCIDAMTIGQITGPKASISNVIRQWEEYLRDMLCALGDGTVDKSSLEGAPGFGEVADYLPGADVAINSNVSDDSIAGKLRD